MIALGELQALLHGTEVGQKFGHFLELVRQGSPEACVAILEGTIEMRDRETIEFHPALSMLRELGVFAWLQTLGRQVGGVVEP